MFLQIPSLKTLSKKLEVLLQTLDNEDCLELSGQEDFESNDGGFATVFVDKTRLGLHFAGLLRFTVESTQYQRRTLCGT